MWFGKIMTDISHIFQNVESVANKKDFAHCEGNYEKSIPSVSPGFITIAIGVHPSRLQIKNKILRLYQT